MNLPYIQSELFRELVGIEPLLKPEYRVRITRWSNGQMSMQIVHLGTEEEPIHIETGFQHIIDSELRKTKDVTQKVNAIWDCIPAECKKDPLK